MENSREEVKQRFGDRLRLRVCGLCLMGNELLLVHHLGVGSANGLWAPPGGGVEFGETAPDALKREFREETGLEIEVGELRCVYEFLKPPLHAVELFFDVQVTGGRLRQGYDPEMQQQIITEVRTMTFAEIKRLPEPEIHRIFKDCVSLEDVFRWKGYLTP